ncbi:MAG: bacterioferritin [Bacteroidetes bacterium QS_8_64_10]|nr:MAG: bacterioferritin [Bacteroidetes bacterium QS_8_64_10]
MPNDDSKQDLIDGLNEDLAYEYQAVLMYTNYSALASGIHRPLLRDFFEEEIVDELRHAQFLSNKITALGGTPTNEPHAFEQKERPAAMLRQVMQAESDTIERYVGRRKQAENYGDHGLAADLDEIISDETNHKEETEKLLRGISEDA